MTLENKNKIMKKNNNRNSLQEQENKRIEELRKQLEKERQYQEDKLKMIKSYRPIFFNNNVIIELTVDEAKLRVKRKINEIYCESSYKKILNANKKQEIDQENKIWNLYESNDKYIIAEQQNSKEINYYKVIRKERATIKKHLLHNTEVIAKSTDDWLYYERNKL